MFRLRQKVREHFPGDNLMTALVEHYATIECAVCSGVGHQSRNCTTLKGLNRFFTTVDVKMEWGAVKSSILVEGMRRRRAINRALRQQLNEDARNIVGAEPNHQGR